MVAGLTKLFYEGKRHTARYDARKQVWYVRNKTTGVTVDTLTTCDSCCIEAALDRADRGV